MNQSKRTTFLLSFLCLIVVAYIMLSFYLAIVYQLFGARTLWLVSPALFPGLILLFFFVRQRSINYQQQKNFQQLTTQAKLQVFADQLSPHFLFNALNNLRFGMILGKGQQLAEDIAKLLEDVEQHTASLTIPINAEINLLQRYMTLLESQFGQKFSLRLRITRAQIDGAPFDLEKIHVLPMILLLLAENCIKHNLNHSTSGFMSISVRLSKNRVFYRVSCSKAEEKKEVNSLNIGHNNIVERLSLFYQGEAKQAHFRFKESTKTSHSFVSFPVLSTLDIKRIIGSSG